MAQPFNKVNATTGDYRGAKGVFNERVIEGLEHQDLLTNGSDLQLTYDSSKNIIVTNVGEYKLILPKADDLINGWTVFIINQDETTELEVVKYSDTEVHSVFNKVSKGKMIQCLLLDNSTPEGEWRLITTSEFEEMELENRYTTSIYKTKKVAYNDLDIGTSKTIELADIPVSTPVKSIFIKPSDKFVGTDVYLSIGTEEEPTKFYSDIPLSVDVLDKNFTKDLFEEILSTTVKQKLYATFYTKGEGRGWKQVSSSIDNDITASFYNNGIYVFLTGNEIITSPDAKVLTTHSVDFSFKPEAVIYENGKYIFAANKNNKFTIVETTDFESYTYHETNKVIDFAPKFFVKTGETYIVVSDYNVFSTKDYADTLSWAYVEAGVYEAIGSLEGIINVAASENFCVISCNEYYFTTTDGINFTQTTNDEDLCFDFLNGMWISYAKDSTNTALRYSKNFVDWQNKDLGTQYINGIKFFYNTWYVFTEPGRYVDQNITVSKDFFNTINRLDTGDVNDYINSICGTPDKLIIAGDNGLIAYSVGEDFFSLYGGEVEIVVEIVKEINPMTIKNPIFNINIPVGTIFSYPFADTPSGYVRLDGTIISDARSLVPLFVEKIESTAKAGFKNILLTAEQYNRLSNEEKLNCGAFSWVDEKQNNLRMPSIDGFIRGIGSGSNLSDLIGKYQTDTIRPITGTIGGQSYQNTGATSGAFYVKRAYGSNGGLEDWAAYADFGLDSSRLGVNYSGSETQPKHVRYPYIMYVYNSVQDSESIQLESVFNLVEESQRIVLQAYQELIRIQGEKSNIVRQTVNTASSANFVRVVSGLNITCDIGVYGNCAQGYVNGIPFDIQIATTKTLNLTLPTSTTGYVVLQKDISTGTVSLNTVSDWIESWTQPTGASNTVWYDTQFEKLYKFNSNNQPETFYAVKIAKFSTGSTTAVITPVKLNYPGKKGFGTWQNIASTGTATEDGIIVVYSGFNQDSGVVIDGVQRQYIAARSKYGQGPESCTCPIAKGSSWSINGGSNGIFFIPLYSYRQGVNY